MDKKLVREWVKNLRSGKFRQGKDALVRFYHKRYSFCCLGVACYPSAKTMNGILETNISLVSGDNFTAKLKDPDLMKRLGVTPKRQEKLIEMNDDEGYSFNKIADWIEKHILKTKHA